MATISNLFIRINELNLTAKNVSESTGISTGNLSDWKNGRCLPSAEKLDKLADFLNCSVDYLLGRTDFADNIATVSKSESINCGITPQERELLEAYRKLNLDGQCKVLSVLYDDKYSIDTADSPNK